MRRGMVPPLQLGVVSPAPPEKSFHFCPSPRKVNVKPDLEEASRAAGTAAEQPAAGKPKIQVVREELPLDYEPTQESIEEYAVWLGMDLETERHLLWISRQALKAPCPEPWKPCLLAEAEGGEGPEVFYFNFQTGESVWDHPVDVHSKKLYLDHRARGQAENGAPVPSLCLALPQMMKAAMDGAPVCSSPRKLTARARVREETSISGGGPDVFGLAAAARAPDAGGGCEASAQRTKITVMEEEIDPSYEPSEEEIREYAAWLGMNMEADEHLFWIARAGLKEKCPEPWKPCRLEDDEVFYFNFATGESIWDHPCDRLFLAMYQEHKTGTA